MISWGRVWRTTTLLLFLLTAAIFLTMNSVWLYRLALNDQTLINIVGESRQVIMHNYWQLLGYLELPWVTHLHMTNFGSSANGLAHFADVKRLFLLNNAVLVVSAWPAIRYYLQLRGTHRRWLLGRVMQVAMVVPVMLIVLIGINFDQFFVIFHQILFRNDDWLFDPRVDPIINALPESFFMWCFILFIVLFEGALAWIYFQGKRDLKKEPSAF